MAYNSNIPQPTDQLSQSQSQLLDNFAYLLTYLQVDHTDLNSGTLQGKHKKVTLPDQSPITPTFSGNDLGIYSETSLITLQNEIFNHIQTAVGTSTLDIPFSASRLSQQSANLITTGWTYIPSGLLIKWGRISPGILDINSGGAFGPNYTQKVYAVFGNNSVGIQQFSLVITTQPPTGAVLTLTTSGGAFAVDWLTIGF